MFSLRLRTAVHTIGEVEPMVSVAHGRLPFEAIVHIGLEEGSWKEVGT